MNVFSFLNYLHLTDFSALNFVNDDFGRNRVARTLISSQMKNGVSPFESGNFSLIHVPLMIDGVSPYFFHEFF